MYPKSLLLSTKLTSHSHDLRETFDIIVGKAPSPVERFTVYSSILTQRSRFLHAARKPEWLDNPSKPVDLTTEDPDIFHEYLNLVYFGPEALPRYVDDYVRQTRPFEVLLAFEGLHSNYDESALIEATMVAAPVVVMSVSPTPRIAPEQCKVTNVLVLRSSNPISTSAWHFLPSRIVQQSALASYVQDMKH
jgi:hypothetical protein